MAVTREGPLVVAQVVPLLRLRHLGDRRFDYLVPPGMRASLSIGSLATVPFGSRRVRAVVVGQCEEEERELADLRQVESLEERRIPEELMTLAGEVAARYLASYESCLRLVVPPVKGRAVRESERGVNDWVFHARAGGVETVAVTAKQGLLLAAIPAAGSPCASACNRAGVSRAVLNTLVRKGVVMIGPAPLGCRPSLASVDARATASLASLSDEQEIAVRDLEEAYASPGLSCRLLWGVTGSGKTEVYLRLVARALADGAGAIMMVPEIALTPQMIDRVRGRFGERVGVVHSGLSGGQRRREYDRIASGEATVVVGARSAVFAPVRNLRLVVLDESHDDSYKQEETPCYQARTVAALRLRRSGGLLLEGSATPAVESLGDRSACVRLTQRVAGNLPLCEVVDMRRQGGSGVLAPASREALGQSLRRGEQAIVLLNRRGFAGFVHCESCGHVMLCGDCEIGLTYHSQIRQLLCHHCGRAYAQPALCPNCGRAPLTRGTPGTERLVEELRRLLPDDHVFRLDSDALTSGKRARDLLERFANTRPAVLVGTQMVAKGHDFGGVTLVVVADADTSLYVPDFRAAERTFQLLTQVSGRAGRSERPGRVVVQTWNPEVPCIRMALDRQEESFYRRELASRERLGFPPATHLIRLLTVGNEAERARLA
jgi:primosomal protein N' (replication factor Y)